MGNQKRPRLKERDRQRNQPLGRLLLSALSGGLAATVGFYNPFLAWICGVPVLLAIRGASVRTACLCGFISGGICVAICGWGLQVGGWPLYLAVIAGLGSFVAAVTGLVAWLGRGREDRPLWILIPSLAWGALSGLVSLADLPVPSSVASSQIPFPPLLQIASLTGPVGVTFLLWLGNASLTQGLALAWEDRRNKIISLGRWMRLAVLAGGCLGTAWIAGSFRLRDLREQGLPTRVAIVQGALPIQAYREAHQDPKKQDFLNERYMTLTAQAASSSPQPQMILWPEDPVLGEFLMEDQLDPAISALAMRTQAALLIGSSTPLYRSYGKKMRLPFRFNSALLISPEGKLMDRYDKRRLTPSESYQPGGRFPVLESPHGRLGLFICEESLYASSRRELAQRGAEILVEMSNDAALGRSPAAIVHAREAVLSAVSFHRPYLRTGQIGPSYIVDAFGRLQTRSGLFEQTVLVGQVAPSSQETLYQKWGDWFPLLCLAICGLLGFRKFRIFVNPA